MKNYQKLLVTIISFWIGLEIITNPPQWVYIDSPTGVSTILFTMGMLSFIAIDWKSLLKFLNQ
jgi:hypothetical protein